MVSTSLRQFLQSICCDSVWDYAVFWKFQQHQNQMLLIWEDGLYDISRQMNPIEDIMDSFYLNNPCERLTSTCTASIHNGSLSSCPLGVAMDEMSSVYYVLGKGLIGEVAFTEIPRWISVDNFVAAGNSSDIIPGCPDKLFHQVVAGIKTMLLVPLVPHGVLQLGSLDMVTEDAGLVINVINKFVAHQHFEACSSPFHSERNCQIKSTKTLEDLGVSNDFGIEGYQISNTTQIISMVQDSNQISRDIMTTIDKGIESKVSMQGVIDVAETYSHHMQEISESEMMQNLFGHSCLDKELGCLSNFSGYCMRTCQNPVDKILQSYSDDGILMLEDCDYASKSPVLEFPTDSELHKALGHALLLNQPYLTFSGQNAAVSSIRTEDATPINVSLGWDSGGQHPNKVKAEYLLEAVVANASNISDDSSSNRSHSETLKSASLKLGSSRQDDLTEENQVPRSCVTSAFSGDRNSAMKISPSTSSFGCMINKLLEEQPQRNRNSVVRPTKGLKLNDGSKRRARSGDCLKPRPRDRQLIQDRIKELRELVPNGAKCSIDGLLDRTIKHMQFLTTVTDQADKIRQHTEEKASTQKDVKFPKVESNTKKGTSWALDMENEQQTCPIIVKDLEYPGHMLIEMLCNDNGRFLEIADVIYRLELTILKGSMEKRSDDSAWAHFVVETSESFHRLDIFWPLMQLLQQNRAQISSKI